MNAADRPTGADAVTVLLASLEHSWKWVDSWKNRRAQLYNFYLIAQAFLTAGYFASIGARQLNPALAIAICGIIAAIICGVVDGRIGMYDQAGEAALSVLQDRLAEMVDCPSLRLVESTRTRTSGRLFGLIVIASFLLGAIAWAVALALAAMRS